MKNPKEFLKYTNSIDGEWLPQEIYLWNQFLENNTFNSSSSIIDIGSGYGKLAYYLLKKLELSPENITCVEPNETLIEAAANREGLSRVHFVNSTFREFDRVGEFDLLISNMVFHYLDDTELEDLVKKSLVLLKDKGILAFSIPHHGMKAHKYGGYAISRIIGEESPWGEKVFYHHRSLSTIFKFFNKSFSKYKFQLLNIFEASESGEEYSGGDRIFFSFKKSFIDN